MLCRKLNCPDYISVAESNVGLISTPVRVVGPKYTEFSETLQNNGRYAARRKLIML